VLVYERVERLSGPDDLILDLGAKGGSNVTETDATVIGIDLEFSKSTENSKTQYLYADGRELPFNDDIFDFVVVNQVIEHVDERKQLFREVRRVLKKQEFRCFRFLIVLLSISPTGFRECYRSCLNGSDFRWPGDF
jgi:ubiquinone/menaquinone biosynthesis C-methylase UbiE